MSDQPTNGNAQVQGDAEKQHHHSNPLSNGMHKLARPPSRIGSDLKDRIKTVTRGPKGGFDTTPLPDAPQGYTVRFIFHSATNLPPADFATASADPFIHATLKGTQPKRHKEDPDLTHRTPTIRRTTEPVWNDEWIVANVPPTGFTLKCRLYDEDYPDADDRLGNVTIRVPPASDMSLIAAAGDREYSVKKRMGSKRAYFVKGVTCLLSGDRNMTPQVRISIEVLGKSDPPFAQMYTVGPTTWVKHFSALIGRIAGTKVNTNVEDDTREEEVQANGKKKRKTQKYDFQANEVQLAGPVPPILYHRYFEFRPIVANVYKSTGLRGKLINTALHEQHRRVYNFNRSTEYGSFPARSEEASIQFLKLAHFDEGSRTFTYILTLDGMLRFTETGKEFGIDMLSKHTMHSDVVKYIACSGEFFIHRRRHRLQSRSSSRSQPSIQPTQSTQPTQSIEPSQSTQPIESTQPTQFTEPTDEITPGLQRGESQLSETPHCPSDYVLYIDNDSGTYRPDKSVLPKLQEFLESNFPGLHIVVRHWADQELQDMKTAQRENKKKKGTVINMVMNMSQSSISSAESALDDREAGWEQGRKSKREMAYDALEDPSKIKDTVKTLLPGARK